MEFSAKLKQLRQAKGISQARLAGDIHISRSAVAKWENGQGLPNEESLKLLAEYFGVDIAAGAFVILAGIVFGPALILAAQIKYIKGIF